MLDKSLPWQKYTIKRYCLKEVQNYILRIIYICSLFVWGLPNSVFSIFYFGKLVFCLLVFNLISVSHEFLIRYHYNFDIFIYVVYISIIWPSVILFSLYKNYFLYLWKFVFHTLVKAYFQREFEWTKNHLSRKMQNSHTI